MRGSVLGDLRVVELGVWVAAPAAAALLADWGFEREGVFWAPAQSPAEVVVDPQLVANDGFVEVDGGALRPVNGPVSFSGVGAPHGAPVPAIGQHTAEVLAGLDGRAAPASDRPAAPPVTSLAHRKAEP